MNETGIGSSASSSLVRGQYLLTLRFCPWLLVGRLAELVNIDIKRVFGFLRYLPPSLPLAELLALHAAFRRPGLSFSVAYLNKRGRFLLRRATISTGKVSGDSGAIKPNSVGTIPCMCLGSFCLRTARKY